jgi:hypothetical protein
MSGTLTPGPPAAGTGGLFGSPAYLAANAAHDGGDPAVVSIAGVCLPVVIETNGALHTPYGYPQPQGECTPGSLNAVARTVVACERPWRLALAPLGPGARLADAIARLMPPATSRPICVHDLDERDPTERFSAGARSTVRRSRRAGARLTVSAPTAEFGRLYRAAMGVHSSPAIYRFDDAYILGLGGAGAMQLTVHDSHALAAGAIFLVAAPEATYHLSARRAKPPPPPGAANLLIAEGLRLCREAGATHCYLGGGMTPAPDDSLLRFKQTMATRVLDRPTFEHPRAP